MNSIEEIKALAPWTEALPSEWKVSRLDDVADVLFSNVDKHTVEGEVPVRLCNYVDVYKNERITGAIDFMEASAEKREINKFQIRPGDVLATKDSEEHDDIAISSLVAEELPGVICGYHLAMIRPRADRIHGSFIAWAHASKAFRAQYEAKAVGVTRFGLSQYAFRTARVPLPPPREQQRIAAYLDASCAAIDAAVAAKHRQIDTLDSLRRSIIQNSVTKGVDSHAQMVRSNIDWLPEIPSHWEKAKLKRHTQMIRGQFSHRPRNDPAFYDGPYPFIQTGSITAADKYITEFTQTLNEDGLRISKLFPAETVVMTITGAKIAAVAVTSFEACFPDSIVGFVPDHHLVRDYLYYLLIAMKPALLRAMVVTTQPNINYVQIGGNYIPLPPVLEQKLIVDHIEQRLRDIKRIAISLESQIATLTAYRKSLIHECVTGQRRVTEADLARVRRAEMESARA
jgi:type I restriction enzyme S subunit